MPVTVDHGIHHVAYACRDLEATNRFYTELMGFELVHTEIKAIEGGYFRHVFYDTGAGGMERRHVVVQAHRQRTALAHARQRRGHRDSRCTAHGHNTRCTDCSNAAQKAPPCSIDDHGFPLGL